jgi:hypothetical protein
MTAIIIIKITIVAVVVTAGAMTSWKNPETKKAIRERTREIIMFKDYSDNDDNNNIIISVPLACLASVRDYGRRRDDATL